MMQSAPLGLVIVADLDCFSSRLLVNEEAKKFSAQVDAGYVSQNIYLYCAAANLATCALGLVKREPLHMALQLKTSEKIVITHVIGHQHP